MKPAADQDMKQNRTRSLAGGRRKTRADGTFSYKGHQKSSRPPLKSGRLSFIKLPAIPVLAFAVFAATTALTGGSSRLDIVWLLILRPITILCLMAMFLTAKRIPWGDIRPIPLLFAAFAITIAMQLVALPPAVWQHIPGREQYNAVALALNGGDQWHPLTLTPDRTWNSLISLLVPFTAMVGFLLLNDRQRRALLLPILGLVAFSMLLGVAQFAGGETSSLYWYSVSGRGQLIGLLANRNHQGALLALTLPLLRVWVLQANHSARKLRGSIGLGAASLIVIYVLVLGSRAGMALAIVGLVGAFMVDPSLEASRQISKRQRLIIISSIAVGVIVLFAMTLNADRAVSIARLVQRDDILKTEPRIQALPTLFHIMAQTFPFGTGFGSFVPVYTSFEPDSLLGPTYFNNAHNDLIELIITGGLPAVFVFAVFLGWWGRASYRCFMASPTPAIQQQRATAWAILILLLASLVDYPLRTPILGTLFTIFACWLAASPNSTEENPA
ncbi:O-antigen ligase family protein [Novosphingobium naphthalenivorans]|uniref:O-antigen ligase family protein n=1 Tax=Novosphingobium naphthalenivorans TaxID=273168 RepID=UPI0009FF3099|nr:O-antigen ligase family protein [Novosphingobium naphthalenivorans]